MEKYFLLPGIDIIPLNNPTIVEDNTGYALTGECLKCKKTIGHHFGSNWREYPINIQRGEYDYTTLICECGTVYGVFSIYELKYAENSFFCKDNEIIQEKYPEYVAKFDKLFDVFNEMCDFFEKTYVCQFKHLLRVYEPDRILTEWKEEEVVEWIKNNTDEFFIEYMKNVLNAIESKLYYPGFSDDQKKVVEIYSKTLAIK